MKRIGGHTWSRFVAITQPFFRSEARWPAIGLLALLIALLLAVSSLNVLNSYVGRDFMTAISERYAARFLWLGLLWAGGFLLITAVSVFYSFTEERLGLRWREWLTGHLLDRYLRNHTYYRMKARADIDNPDQRIAEDVKTFTTTALSFLLIGINSVLALCSFSGVLWSITPWLFFAAAGYAAFGSLATVLLGRRLIRWDVLQFKKEADFRYELIRVREHAEPVALSGGEADERRRLGGRLTALVDNMRHIIALNRNIGFFTTGYDNLTQLIPLLIVGPLYIRGAVEFGSVTQAQWAFFHVMGAFSLIVKQFKRISEFGAVVERLGAAWEATEDHIPDAAKPTVEIIIDDRQLAFERLTLLTPREGRAIVKDLSVQVPEGKRLLILGPHGSGRTALLCASAGLWTSGTGRIVRPGADDLLFLPQQPYLHHGTLREQLLYANRRAEPYTDDEILAALRAVRLDEVARRVGGLDAEADWPRLLSRGEQQVLAVARLLLASPRFAFLDEATSALDAKHARRLYAVLARSPITYLSVGNDAALREYHDLVLELRGKGAWVLSSRAETDGALRHLANGAAGCDGLALSRPKPRRGKRSNAQV